MDRFRKDGVDGVGLPQDSNATLASQELTQTWSTYSGVLGRPSGPSTINEALLSIRDLIKTHTEVPNVGNDLHHASN